MTRIRRPLAVPPHHHRRHPRASAVTAYRESAACRRSRSTKTRPPRAACSLTSCMTATSRRDPRHFSGRLLGRAPAASPSPSRALREPEQPGAPSRTRPAGAASRRSAPGLRRLHAGAPRHRVRLGRALRISRGGAARVAALGPARRGRVRARQPAPRPRPLGPRPAARPDPGRPGRVSRAAQQILGGRAAATRAGPSDASALADLAGRAPRRPAMAKHATTPTLIRPRSSRSPPRRRSAPTSARSRPARSITAATTGGVASSAATTRIATSAGATTRTASTGAAGASAAASGSLCLTPRGNCITRPLPYSSPCGCDLPGFGRKRGAIGG